MSQPLETLQITVAQTIASLRALGDTIPLLEDGPALLVMQEVGRMATSALVLRDLSSPIAAAAPEAENAPVVADKVETLPTTTTTTETLGLLTVQASFAPSSQPTVTRPGQLPAPTGQRESPGTYTARDSMLLEILKQNPGHHYYPNELTQQLLDAGLANSRSAARQAVTLLQKKLKLDPKYSDRLHDQGNTTQRIIWLDAEPDSAVPTRLPVVPALISSVPKQASPADMAGRPQPKAAAVIPAAAEATKSPVKPPELRLVQNGHLELLCGPTRLKLGTNALAILKRLTDLKQPVSFIDLADIVAKSRLEPRNHTHPEAVNQAILQIADAFEGVGIAPLRDEVVDHIRRVALPVPIYFENLDGQTEVKTDFLGQ